MPEILLEAHISSYTPVPAHWAMRHGQIHREPIHPHIPTSPSSSRLSISTLFARRSLKHPLAFNTSNSLNSLLPSIHFLLLNNQPKMSVTTTTNQIHYTLHATLADYALHHSPSSSSSRSSLDTSLNTHPAPSPSSQNPSNWPTEHRRVPAYRPINTALDQSERRVYLSSVERVFVGVMFTGVYLQSVS